MKSESAFSWTFGPLILMCLLMCASLSFAATSPVRGTVEKISTKSITIDSALGKVTVDLGPNVQFLKRIPSDLSHVTSKTYVGVTTVKQPDGKELATEIHIFPNNLRGTNEGSFMLDEPASSNRMTNGTVATAHMKKAKASSRMTNGTVGIKQGASSMVVQYKGGEQTITIPDNISVTEIVVTEDRPVQGAPIAFLPQKKSDGSYTTSKITLIAPAAK